MSEAQQIAIAVIPKFSAFLSICGSGFIIYDILTAHFNVPLDWWRKEITESEPCQTSGTTTVSGYGCLSSGRHGRSRDRKTLTNSAYCRLMLAMSASDFVVSFAWFCTTWPIPKDEYSIDNPSDVLYGNVGTMQTCTAQAFFIQLGIITPFYNALLSLYYYLTICREWKETKFKHNVEYAGHFVSLSFGLGTALAGLFMDLYNNSKVWCWIAPYPMGCGSEDNPCERGINSKMLRWAFYYGPLWCMIFLVVFFMSLVYVYVRSLDAKMDEYTNTYRKRAISQIEGMAKSRNLAASSKTRNSLLSREEGSNLSSVREAFRRSIVSRMFPTRYSYRTQARFDKLREEQKHKRSKAVAKQGAFYAGGFAFVWLFGTITRAMQLAGAKVPWAIIFLFAVFTPCQGFFNFLVYIRPRRIKYNERKRKLRERKNGESNVKKSNTSYNSDILPDYGPSTSDDGETGFNDPYQSTDDAYDTPVPRTSRVTFIMAENPTGSDDMDVSDEGKVQIPHIIEEENPCSGGDDLDDAEKNSAG